MDPSAEEIIEILTAELMGAPLRDRRLGEVAARVAARHLVKRLNLIGIEWRRRPPAPFHSTRA